MPCPIVMGFIEFLASNTNLNASIWDGEVPRYDVAGKPINPDSTATNPSNWPAIHLYQQEPGFARTWSFANSYDDDGQMFIELFAIGRLAAEALTTQIEVLLAQEANWVAITALLGDSPDGAPPGYGLAKCLLSRWYTGMNMIGNACQRSAKGELIYKGQLTYDVSINGSVLTIPA